MLQPAKGTSLGEINSQSKLETLTQFSANIKNLAVENAYQNFNFSLKGLLKPQNLCLLAADINNHSLFKNWSIAVQQDYFQVTSNQIQQWKGEVNLNLGEVIATGREEQFTVKLKIAFFLQDNLQDRIFSFFEAIQFQGEKFKLDCCEFFNLESLLDKKWFPELTLRQTYYFFLNQWNRIDEPGAKGSF